MISRRGLVAGAFGTTVATAAVALPARSQGQFYPGASVQGITIEGMSQSDSEEMLRAAFTPLEDQAVTYTFEDQTWPASLTDLGMIVDYESMLEQAWNQGRDGSVIDRYATLLNQGDTHNVPLSVLQDDLKLSAFLENIDEQIHIDSKNARLVRRGSEIDILADATGRALDLEAARNETIAAVLTGRTSTVALKSIPIPPDVAAADLEGAKEDAITLVGEPVIFTYGDITYYIDTEELTGALTIDRDGTAVLNLEKLQGRLDDIAADVLTPAANAKLGWDDGVYVIEDDVDGTGLDLEVIGPLLLDTARTTTRSVPLPVQTLKAGARADNIEELGLDGHLTYGSSSFAGSSETRAANVIAACDNVSYKLVGPGEQFSFNDQMGQISIENGFVEGKIIQGNWTASDLGGGVCQVSTTVFRAALLSGFKFNEWYAHGWRLAFYEADGSPPGMDAAIYQPNNADEFEKDLVFENPLDSWLLLMMVVDGDTAYAHLYGRDNGWTTEIFEPRVSEPKEPGEPVTRENPELARGERRKVQNAQPGYTVYLQRKVSDADGNVVSDGDFVSDYRSQPEAWEVGPGTPGITATPPA